jgi:hypothetical protein
LSQILNLGTTPATRWEAAIIPEGESKIEVLWDRNDPESVASAREKFLRLAGLGWLAFATLPDGRNVHVLSFDASLERVTFMIPVEGG